MTVGDGGKLNASSIGNIVATVNDIGANGMLAEVRPLILYRLRCLDVQCAAWPRDDSPAHRQCDDG